MTDTDRGTGTGTGTGTDRVLPCLVCVSFPAKALPVMRYRYQSFSTRLFPDPAAVVVVESVTDLKPAVFRDSDFDAEYRLPLWIVACHESLAVTAGHPKFDIVKHQYDMLKAHSDSFERVSASADGSTLTYRGSTISRVCVQVLDLVCMFHRMEAKKSTLPKALAPMLTKMTRSAACVGPNFTRALLVNGRSGGSGSMTLHEFLEQVTFVTSDDSSVAGEIVLDRMVALAGQYVAKYSWDTYEFRDEDDVVEEGRGRKKALRVTRRVRTDRTDRTDTMSDDDGPHTVQVWMRRQLTAGQFEEEEDRSRIRHFLSCQRVAKASKDNKDKDKDTACVQWIKRTPWYDAELRPKFPRYCHPFEMGSVMAECWSVQDTYVCLDAFDSRIQDIKTCWKVKQKFDSELAEYDWYGDEKDRKIHVAEQKISDKKERKRRTRELQKTRGDE
jgi:hypothetical protein